MRDRHHSGIFVSAKLVDKAWTDPDQLKKWWDPNGFTNTFHLVDFTVGIREHELLVGDRQSKPIFQVEVAFNELAENETRVTFKQKFATADECSKLRKFVPEKNEENMDRLESELKTMV